MKDDFMRVQDVKIWIPQEYSVYDKQYCKECPSDLIWIDELPKLKEIENSNNGLEDDD